MQLVFKRILKEERGNALIFGIGALIITLGVAGFAIDGSLLFMKKSQLQKEANAAVLSGAMELPNTEQKVKDTVQYILNSHQDSSSLEKLDIEMGKKVGVTLKKSVKLTFSSLFGFEKEDVQVHSAAGLAAIGKSTGAAPLGIDESITLEYYKTYQLKVDSSGVTSGNFGVLALSGPGAKTYEQNLRYGYQE
jgi:hypothetical protein